MAAPRISFAYSNFFRAVHSCRPKTYQSLRKQPVNQSPRVKLHTTPRRAQTEGEYQRYGPAANQSLPPPPKPSDGLSPKADAAQDPSRVEKQPEQPKEEKEKVNEAAEQTAKEAKKVQDQPKAQAEARTGAGSEAKPEEYEPLQNPELDMVLSIPSPAEVKGEAHRHPHLEASPYEHHFDTYTLVQDLAREGFTEAQSITLMKAIRLMLAENLDIAKEGLVSKSDTENETYLFRAACSELKTTIQTTRHTESQRQSSQRAQLQHEFDILNQKVTQDVMNMREELKGMFNDRKLSLQEEKRKVDGNIQHLNYGITVQLNSDSKSEVEGLRWVLTRRAALAIASAAFMTLSFLQYYSVKSREQAEIEKKRKAAEKQQEDRLAMEQARFTTPSRSSGTQTDSGTPAREYEESLG